MNICAKGVGQATVAASKDHEASPVHQCRCSRPKNSMPVTYRMYLKLFALGS